MNEQLTLLSANSLCREFRDVDVGVVVVKTNLWDVAHNERWVVEGRWSSARQLHGMHAHRLGLYRALPVLGGVCCKYLIDKYSLFVVHWRNLCTSACT